MSHTNHTDLHHITTAIAVHAVVGEVVKDTVVVEDPADFPLAGDMVLVSSLGEPGLAVATRHLPGLHSSL